MPATAGKTRQKRLPMAATKQKTDRKSSQKNTKHVKKSAAAGKNRA